MDVVWMSLTTTMTMMTTTEENPLVLGLSSLLRR